MPHPFNRRPLSDTPVFGSLDSPPYQPLSSPNGSIQFSKVSYASSEPPIPPLQLAPRRSAVTLDVPGLTRSKSSPDGAIAARDVEAKLVIVMVGLPARGKSYVTNKLCRFLNWQQYSTKIFNVGNKRRSAGKSVGPEKGPLPDNEPELVTSPRSAPASRFVPQVQTPEEPAPTAQSAEFFAPDNPDTFVLREQWAMDTLEDLLDFILNGGGSVGILDATNTTIARRRKVLHRIKQRTNGRLKVLFLESICSSNSIIEANIRLKLNGPDYKDIDANVAIQDFIQRMRNYEKVYQTIGPEEEALDEFQYIKMIDVGLKIVCCNINGHLAGQVVFYLLNFNLAERQIWVTRHGESEDNTSGRIGGDSSLTERGHKFARAAAKFMAHKKKEFYQRQIVSFSERERILHMAGSEPPSPMNELEEPSFCVWTSMMQRAIQTGEYFDEDLFDMKQMRMLNELGAGKCDGMTYAEIQKLYPRDYATRIADKVQYRYPGPGGESYLDVINRLRPVIVELERMEDNVLIIAHRVVCRILLAYFMNLGREAIGDLDVPLHTLYCLEHKPYGVSWEVYEYDEATDWFNKVSKEVLKSRAIHHERAFSVVASRTDVPLAGPRSVLTDHLNKLSLNAEASGLYKPVR